MLFAHLLEFQALVVPSNQIQNTQHTLNAVQTQAVSQHTHTQDHSDAPYGGP